jgi:hypothetical protein
VGPLRTFVLKVMLAPAYVLHTICALSRALKHSLSLYSPGCGIEIWRCG